MVLEQNEDILTENYHSINAAPWADRKYKKLPGTDQKFGKWDPGGWILLNVVNDFVANDLLLWAASVFLQGFHSPDATKFPDFPWLFKTEIKLHCEPKTIYGGICGHALPEIFKIRILKFVEVNSMQEISLAIPWLWKICHTLKH